MTNNAAAARPPDPVTRRRGAQPGNKNALRHGLYSRTFQPGELADLDQLIATDLQPELNALRISLRRLMDLTANIDTPADAMLQLDAVGKAASRIAGIAQAQRVMAGDHAGELDEALRVVLIDVHNAITLQPGNGASSAEPPPARPPTVNAAQFQHAMEDCFTMADLVSLLLYTFDRRLDEFAAPADPLPAAIQKVIAAAQRECWLPDLVRAAAEQRPRHHVLQQLARALP